MNNIEELIPQKAPIVMVDELLHVDGPVSDTVLKVVAENLFVDDGVLSECGLIEHIAQSAAARIGSLFAREGKRIPVGYIASVNGFTVETLPKVGESVHTRITVLQEVMNLTLIEARCRVGEREIAVCRMKIILEENGRG